VGSRSVVGAGCAHSEPERGHQGECSCCCEFTWRHKICSFRKCDNPESVLFELSVLLSTLINEVEKALLRSRAILFDFVEFGLGMLSTPVATRGSARREALPNFLRCPPLVAFGYCEPIDLSVLDVRSRLPTANGD